MTVTLMTGQTMALKVGEYRISAEGTINGVVLKSAELPIALVPVFYVTPVASVLGGAVGVEVIESEFLEASGSGFRLDRWIA